MTKKFREVLLIDITGLVDSDSDFDPGLLMHSIDEVERTFLLAVTNALVDGRREKLVIRTGKTVCADPDDAKIHTCLKTVKLIPYKTLS